MFNHATSFAWLATNPFSIKLGGAQMLTNTAYYKSTDTAFIFSSPRISLGINVLNVHFALSKTNHILFGFNLKNIGIAERFNSIRYRERMLTIGCNLKHKINVGKQHCFVSEIGFDYNVQFKHQHWMVHHAADRHILSDALSQTLVKPFQPFVGIGVQQNHLGLELNYYVNNFYNKLYAGNNLSVMHKFREANLIVAKFCYYWR
jgi:hypothetical protein